MKVKRNDYKFSTRICMTEFSDEEREYYFVRLSEIAEVFEKFGDTAKAIKYWNYAREMSYDESSKRHASNRQFELLRKLGAG